MQRRKLLVALAGLAAVIAAGVWALPPRACQFSEYNRRLIKQGMSPAEVLAILGPPADYRTGLQRASKSLNTIRRVLEHCDSSRNHHPSMFRQLIGTVHFHSSIQLRASLSASKCGRMTRA